MSYSYSKVYIKDATIERELLNRAHVEFPQPGDYWHEMFCPYFVILEVLEDHVIICDKRKNIDRDTWEFDYSEVKLFTKKELEKKVKYSSMDKFVADVCPNRLSSDIKEWKEMFYVKKTSNLINISNPQSIDLQSKCRGDKL